MCDECIHGAAHWIKVTLVSTGPVLDTPLPTYRTLHLVSPDSCRKIPNPIGDLRNRVHVSPLAGVGVSQLN